MAIRRRTLGTGATVVALVASAATLSALTVAQAAPAAPVPGHDPVTAQQKRADNLDGPMSRTQRAQREQALKEVIHGQAKVQDRDGSQVVALKGKDKNGKSKYVELGREKTDKIFTILVEFGDQVDSRYGGTPGPLHNRIAEPDRTEDNSTDWRADYDQAHYQDIYFGDGEASLKSYYEKQSSGRYSVDGEVSDWVKVPYNEARYGSNEAGDAAAWNAVQDGLTAWVAGQKAQGRTDADIKADLAEYDEWDRYDYDADGDFNEPDGYVDHFQLVHAGEDESAGGGDQGEDAIWAHRWYAFGTDAGLTGPDMNKLGGTQVGNTGIWVGDYTIQPENGGVGVFAHEYGHDLGLPDEYDTNGGENSTGFWTLMSSGSWMGTGENAIGNLPDDMNAWDKLQLGWLHYTVVDPKKSSSTKLGYAEYNTSNPQGLIVPLPEKEVTQEVVAPAQGDFQWWSGSGNDLKNTLSREVDLTGKSSAELTFDAWYDIEQDYDFLYTEVSTDGGATWKAIDGTTNGQAIPRDASGTPSLSGSNGAYAPFAYSLDAYAGQKIQIRFRYQTDGGLALKGFAADRIAVTAGGTPSGGGEVVFSDDAENADAAWKATGFTRVGASYTDSYAQYYVAENRQYVSYDRTLAVGPYNFGFASRPDWVEHIPYQNGLLLWKWDTSEVDNNTGVHPGTGLILPVDAHPGALKWADGTLLRNRFQAYDSVFGLDATDAITMHKADVPVSIPSQPAVPVFDDHANTYYDPANPAGGVKITDTNTRIQVAKEAKDGSTVTVNVGPAVK